MKGTIMKHRIIFSIPVIVGALLWSTSFALTAQGQQPKRKLVADTGVVTLGPNQMLRLAGDWNGDGVTSVQFRQVAYMPAGCNDGVCKHTVVSQSTSAPVTLMSGEAASIDIDNYSWGIRAMVLSDNPNMRVNVMIVDKTTGNIIAILVGG